MTNVRIAFKASDHAMLDRAIAKVLTALPADADALVNVNPRQGNLHARQIVIANPNEDTINLLTRVDIPHDVAIHIDQL